MAVYLRPKVIRGLLAELQVNLVSQHRRAPALGGEFQCEFLRSFSLDRPIAHVAENEFKYVDCIFL